MTQFVIYLLDAGANRLGDAALVTASDVNDTRQLDKIGSLDFSFPAADPVAVYLDSATQVDVYDDADGYIGRYSIATVDTSEDNGIGTLRVQCDESLIAFQKEFVGFRRVYSFEPVENVITQLAALAGWSAEVDADIGNTTVIYEGESIHAAIDEMRDRWGKHFRVEALNTIKFGAMGDLSPVLLTNTESVAGGVGEDIGIITALQKSKDISQVYNKVIPLGAGQGEARVSIQDTSGYGTYTTQTGVNADGSNYYFIEDASSVAAYGRRTRIVNFPTIAPIANNDTDIARARGALKLAAEAYIARSLPPNEELSVTAVSLPSTVKVGDRVLVRYQKPYLSINAYYYVMDITRRRSATGERMADIILCSIDKRRTSDMDVIIDTIHDLKSLRVHIQPYPFWSENTWEKFIQGWTDTIGREYKPAIFKLEVDNSVTHVTKVRIRFKTDALFTPMYFGGVFGTAIADAIYQVVKATHYPYFIRCWVNGVDISAAIGGPWATSLPATAIDISADITTYIVNASGGLRQDHVIMFTAENTTGDAAVGNPPTITNIISHGTIELNVRVQGVTQGIVPT